MPLKEADLGTNRVPTSTTVRTEEEAAPAIEDEADVAPGGHRVGGDDRIESIRRICCSALADVENRVSSRLIQAEGARPWNDFHPVYDFLPGGLSDPACTEELIMRR